MLPVSGIRIGVDTGGTFTDLVLDPGAPEPLLVYKLLSTPDDPSRAVIQGVDTILSAYASRYKVQIGPPVVFHGSTVATNAVLEGKGARAAFVTTEGFEHTLEIARQNRPDLYALDVVKPAPPVPVDRCIGVRERIGPGGEIWRRMVDGEGERIAAELVALGVESVAVSLLHSYRNPDHEQRLAATLREAVPGVHVTVSSELLPEYREYERAATCIINAIVAPPMIGYLHRVTRKTGPERLRILASAGGNLPVSEVERVPVNTILSGPAGGVLGAWAVAQDAGLDRIITFDMGGTSTDVALCDGGPGRTTESAIGGLPLKLPMIDIHTVGAGGGSVAWLDAGGALRVGPESAGADPGPACYGRQSGSLTPTVTDAHVVLGNMPPDQPLSGAISLDVKAASEAVSLLAHRANMPEDELASGILRIAEVAMTRAIQRISVERGQDPRDFTLIPFGGAGGLHACSLAQGLGISRILLPRYSGLLSAIGMLASAPLYTFSRTILIRLERGPAGYPDPAAKQPFRDAEAELRRMGERALERDNVAPRDRSLNWLADLRYAGQAYELSVPIEGDIIAAFGQRHEELYGYSMPDKPVEVVTLRLEAAGKAECLRIEPLHERKREEKGPPLRPYGTGGQTDAPQWCHVERGDLLAGDEFSGPAILTEYAATTVIYGDWHVEVLPAGHLLLSEQKQISGFPTVDLS